MSAGEGGAEAGFLVVGGSRFEEQALAVEDGGLVAPFFASQRAFYPVAGGLFLFVVEQRPPPARGLATLSDGVFVDVVGAGREREIHRRGVGCCRCRRRRR